jgi:molecular chaperone DnaK
MSTTIDIGIDLGTTNSAIARFRKGTVEVFKNPLLYGQSTLPSVVAYRKDKIDVGSKAREYIEKRPGDVVTAFKRRMGTNETYPIRSLGRSVSPVELSAHVLKTLKGFVPEGEPIDAAVITIPASFDTLQSNATRQAGEQAGFQQVVLLQEPIAASLAYANKAAGGPQISGGRWLVYDLGGGTFDVALVEISHGEMKIVDHEGDNFLGGTDFDRIIVERFIIPRLEEAGDFADLEAEMKSATGAHNAVYHGLLRRAEELKISLSGSTSAEVEVDITDDNGDHLTPEFTLTRSEFESFIRNEVDKTISMVKSILTRNNMQARDVQFILMVGGSTYIPYVRSRVGEVLGIPINCDIDPTTAIAIGAAYFAGTKRRELTEAAAPLRGDAGIRVKMAYHKATQEDSEFFAAQVDGPIDGFSYRITRDDGGFDSGIRPLQSRISEDLPLVRDAFNYFTLTVLDAQGNQVQLNTEPIGIAHGKFSVAGQPLPHDISLERDDIDNQDTYLELLFKKNETLPLRRTRPVQLNRTVVKGSNDAIRVRVIEGPHDVHPDSNQTVGHLEIKGTMLSRDAVRGSDVEITIVMSESRDITASAYLAMTDQEFSEVFRPQARATPVEFLHDAAEKLNERVEEELETAEEAENYEVLQELRELQREAEGAAAVADALMDDDVTDQRYQLEDRIRKLNQQLDVATKDKRIQAARQEYADTLEWCRNVITQGGNDHERRALDHIIADERVFLSSENPARIREKVEELNRLGYTVLFRTPAYLHRMFTDLSGQASRMNDQAQAKNLIAAGQFAIEHGNWDRLREVNFALVELLPTHERPVFAGRIGF